MWTTASSTLSTNLATAVAGLAPGSFLPPIINMVLDGIPLCGSIVETRLDLREVLPFAGEGLRFMPPNRYYANAGEVVTDLSPASVLGRQALEDAISFFYLSEARLTSTVSKP